MECSIQAVTSPSPALPSQSALHPMDTEEQFTSMQHRPHLSPLPLSLSLPSHLPPSHIVVTPEIQVWQKVLMGMGYTSLLPTPYSFHTLKTPTGWKSSFQSHPIHLISIPSTLEHPLHHLPSSPYSTSSSTLHLPPNQQCMFLTLDTTSQTAAGQIFLV